MARAKPAKTSESYYLVIKGKKYDRRMVELADGLTSGRGDGRISMNDAQNLLRLVKDSNTYSPVEKQTMDYIRRKYKFTKEADELFRTEIRKWAASKRSSKSSGSAKKSAGKAVATAPAPTVPVTASVSSPVSTELPEPKAQGSAFKEIFFALLLLLGIAALFYFIIYKSGCVKPKTVEAPPVTAVQTVPTIAPEAPKAVAAPVVASSELNDFVEKTKLAFVAEKTALTPNSAKALDVLAAKIKNENKKLQITGHTCSLGPKALNQEISVKRANAVKAALIARGVKAESLEVRGVGDSEPIADNKVLAGRVANRRVTLKVLQ